MQENAKEKKIEQHENKRGFFTSGMPLGTSIDEEELAIRSLKVVDVES